METITGTEARQRVQNHLNQKKEERLSHKADMEAIGVIDRKHEAERRQAQAAARRIQEKMEAQRLREEEAEAEERRQEEAILAAREEGRRNLRGAMPVSLAMCSLGSLHIVGAYNPDVALTAGGLLVLAGLLYAGLAIVSWHSC